jgi:hypothetical protein
MAAKDAQEPATRTEDQSDLARFEDTRKID